MNNHLHRHGADCGTRRETVCNPWSRPAAIGLFKTPSGRIRVSYIALAKVFLAPCTHSHSAVYAPNGLGTQAPLWTITTLAPTSFFREPSVPFQALVWHLHPPEPMLAWGSNWLFAAGSPLLCLCFLLRWTWRGCAFHRSFFLSLSG